MRYNLENNNRWHLLHLALNSLYFRTLFLQVGRTKWSHLRSHQQPWNISVAASRFSERPWNFSERPLRSRSLPWNIPMSAWCDTWCDHWCDYATRKWLLIIKQLSARCKRCGYIMMSGITGSVLLIIFRSLISLCFITCLIRISFNLKKDQKNRILC